MQFTCQMTLIFQRACLTLAVLFLSTGNRLAWSGTYDFPSSPGNGPIYAESGSAPGSTTYPVATRSATTPSGSTQYQNGPYPPPVYQANPSPTTSYPAGQYPAAQYPVASFTTPVSYQTPSSESVRPSALAPSAVRFSSTPVANRPLLGPTHPAALPPAEPPAEPIPNGQTVVDHRWMPSAQTTSFSHSPSVLLDENDPSCRPIVVDTSRVVTGCDDVWCWQVLPEGLIYRSYMAGAKEPRIASQWVYDKNLEWIWDIALGGRVGILRYGNENPIFPTGFQVDIEGAALLRLDLENERDVVATDYRFGIPLTFGNARHQCKLAYYHLSSHLGDEYMIRNPGARRINYVRDAMVLGYSLYFFENHLRLYSEAAYAFHTDGGAKPWEFQFGFEYTAPEPTGWRPTPFVAVGGHIREENDYCGNVVIQSGWLWRGDCGQTFRMGMQYYSGMSDQYEFFDQYENKIGFGLWYDY